MDLTANPFMSDFRRKEKKSDKEPSTDPKVGPSFTEDGQPVFRPISFSPESPPSRKRPHSDTVSTLPHVDEEYLKDSALKHSVVILEMIYLIHKDYRAWSDRLAETIDSLMLVIEELHTNTLYPDTPTPIPFPSSKVKVPEPPKEPSTQPLPPSSLVVPATTTPSRATMAKEGQKKSTVPGKVVTAVTKNTTTTIKPSQPKKGPTTREYCLIIKQEGAPLDIIALALRDRINQALASTYIRTISVHRNTITLTTLESVKATSLNSKLLVHGLPTASSLSTIAMELSNYDAGLALTGQPQWLTSDNSRAGKSASTVIITITGPKVPSFVGRYSVAFSITYRTECHLHFNSSTQRPHCYGFGHHNNKCPNLASCQ
ncbi:hypothetical protein C7212DRAFT_341995 [Tuber magnatum]|uniref:Uncharacterized protein n=1 Tax=Tuber magnatum TaxID=42249 RepID=A0A317T0Q7_9PEZI|nr:hypothetical protein C7212DRAFT_341995 [Tuber magnatum]